MSASMTDVITGTVPTKSQNMMMTGGDEPEIMSKEKHFDVLDEILQRVIKNEVPSDDTFLEKITTLIESHVFGRSQGNDSCQSKESSKLKDDILKRTCLNRCFSECHSACEDPQSVAFLLRVAGILGSAADDELEENIMSVFSSVPTSCHWEDASARYGWLQGVRKLAHSRQGINFIFKAEFTATITKCLDDSSLYVSKAAAAAVAEILTSALRHGVGYKEPHDVSHQLLSFVMSGMTDETSHEEKPCSYSNALDILTLVSSNTDLMTTLCEKFSLHDCVKQKLRNSTNEKRTVDLCTLILAMEERFAVVCVDAPGHVIIHGDIRQAILICSKIIKRTSAEMRKSFVNYVLSPFSVCTESMECTLEDTEKTRVEEFCATKSQHIKLAQRSLSGMKSMTHELSLSERVFVSLSLTTYLKSSIDNTSTPLGQNLIGNSKLNAAVLDVLNLLMEKGIGGLKSEALDTVIQVTSSTLTSMLLSQTILSTCFSTVVNIIRALNKCADTDIINTRDKLIPAYLNQINIHTKKRLSDVQWESRDTTLEFLSEIIKLNVPVVTSWLIEEDYPRIIWQSVEDGEGYVRASALHTIRHISHNAALWRNLVTSGACSADDVFQKVITILKEDLEAFTRRAAVDVLNDWHNGGDLYRDKSDQILAALTFVLDDYDWEVKIKTIKFWEAFMRVDQDGGVERVEVVWSMATGGALVKALNDHDRSVQRDACRVFISLLAYLDSRSDLPARCEALRTTLTALVLRSMMVKFESSIDEHRDVAVFLQDVLVSLKPIQEYVPLTEDDGTGMNIDCY